MLVRSPGVDQVPADPLGIDLAAQPLRLFDDGEPCARTEAPTQKVRCRQTADSGPDDDDPWSAIGEVESQMDRTGVVLRVIAYSGIGPLLG
jgi:hypothetical protein